MSKKAAQLDREISDSLKAHATAATRQPAPAILRTTSAPWYHFTHPSRLDAIVRGGLDPKPRVRTYAQGALASLAGIYVVADEDEQYTYVAHAMMEALGTRHLAVLRLRLHVGTPFCLDEDELANWHGKYVDPEDVTPKPGIDPALFREAVIETEPDRKFDRRRGQWLDRGVTSERSRRSRLDAWSCRLAHELDQRQLKHWKLRVFQSPEILGVTQF